MLFATILVAAYCSYGYTAVVGSIIANYPAAIALGIGSTILSVKLQIVELL